jgi:D-alanyl-D-alanine endopeptidase (penicillin-binding protein 7)
MIRNVLLGFIATFVINAQAAPITAHSWLIADKDGQIIQGQNTNEVRSIASISKLITVMTFLDAVEDPTWKEKELIRQAITSSSNVAARELCNRFPGGYHECIKHMNDKTKDLGLTNTKFVEPTGLSVFNVSTAEELIKIVNEASKYPLIVQSSNVRERNTNPTIGKYNYTVSKTGYISASGGCIVAMVNEKIIVLLGSKTIRTRIPELERLIKI